MKATGKYRDHCHARIYAYWVNLPAWRHSCTQAHELLILTLVLYRTNKPNSFEWSERSAALAIGCSRAKAKKAIAELVECGWFKVERAGRITGARATRPSVYSLCMYPTEMCDTPAMDFETWRPVAPKITTDGSLGDHQRPVSEPPMQSSYNISARREAI
jgi:hypothetical protein